MCSSTWIHRPQRWARPWPTSAVRSRRRCERWSATTRQEQDPGYEGAAAVAIQFSAWMVAARAMQGKDGVDLTPELRIILELARVRHRSYVMRQDVVRVASYYLQQWAGLAPLPTNPKPGGEG